MIDPIQPQTTAAPPVSSSEPSSASSGSSSSDGGPPASAAKPAAPSRNEPSPQADQASSSGASGSNGASDSQSSSDAVQPLRLLIEHDKTTNQYVYKLYDSSGRIVREIPQESLADAEKQASGAPGAVIDTKV